MENEWAGIAQVVLVVFLFGGWVIASVAKTIATNWRKVRESEHLAALKQSMVERGLSADEIERIIRAGHEAREPAEQVASS